MLQISFHMLLNKLVEEFLKSYTPNLWYTVNLRGQILTWVFSVRCKCKLNASYPIKFRNLYTGTLDSQIK